MELTMPAFLSNTERSTREKVEHYPYFTKGLVYGILFSTILWVLLIFSVKQA